MRVAELSEVIVTAGVVLDGLSTSRAATDRYLRSGDTSGVRGRGDLALLQDLEDAASCVLETADDPLNADYLKQLNAQLPQSAAINPGSLRTGDQGIGVNTRFGRHDPPAVPHCGCVAVHGVYCRDLARGNHSLCTGSWGG